MGYDRSPNTVNDVLAIVPALNEESGLPALLQELRTTAPAWDVLVINDGSTDRTSAVARDAGVAVLDLPYNAGVATAEQAGFLYALGRGYRYVVRLDGDGQHLPSEAARVLAPVRAGEADVAIGSRYLAPPRPRASLPRRLGIAWLSWLLSRIARQAITDPTSGLRAFDRRVMAFCGRIYPEQYPEPESILLLARHGFRLCEVPVSMRERRGGQTSLRPLRAFYYIFKVTFALGVELLRRPTPVEDRP